MRAQALTKWPLNYALFLSPLSSLSLTQWNGGIKLPHIYVGERFFYPPGKGNEREINFETISKAKRVIFTFFFDLAP